MKSDWEITQERQLIDYAKGADVFSMTKREGAIKIGRLLTSLIPNGTCLDVGCGILPLPEYMKIASNVRFTGIDPFEAEGRKFEFIKGKAESMPFPDNTFDAVIFATSLDHMEQPEQAIREAFRVLNSDGYLLIWGTFRESTDEKYKLWKEIKSLDIYNHPWAFTLNSIKPLMNDFKHIKIVGITHKEKILIYHKEDELKKKYNASYKRNRHGAVKYVWQYPLLYPQWKRFLTQFTNEKILDFGSGPGFALKAGKELGLDITGLDINMEEVYRDLNKRYGVTPIHYNGHDFPAFENKFDVIILHWSLIFDFSEYKEYKADISNDKLLKRINQLKAITNEGGCWYISPLPHYNIAEQFVKDINLKHFVLS